ncbi:MAG TPA: aminodeoxychorismate/anthranilate synthase component II [Oscillatoriaceae cyanobacterium]
MPKLLVIDNYDSFTYNLVQMLGELGAELVVRRNDAITLDEIARMAPDGIVLSPGPGRPEDAGVTCAVLERFGAQIPVLGVCLGHQAIGLVFGGEVVRAERVMHGKTSAIAHNGEGLFAGLSAPFTAARYHSLLVRRETLPDCLEATAWTAEGEIMGLRHRRYPIVGVQFHPESVLTVEGQRLLSNFLASLATPMALAS